MRDRISLGLFAGGMLAVLALNLFPVAELVSFEFATPEDPEPRRVDEGLWIHSSIRVESSRDGTWGQSTLDEAGGIGMIRNAGLLGMTAGAAFFIACIGAWFAEGRTGERLALVAGIFGAGLSFMSYQLFFVGLDAYQRQLSVDTGLAAGVFRAQEVDGAFLLWLVPMLVVVAQGLVMYVPWRKLRKARKAGEATKESPPPAVDDAAPPAAKREA